MTELVAFFASPLFLGAVIVGVIVEALALIAWHRRTGRGPRPLLVCSFLGAGLALFVALYVIRAQDTPGRAFIIALLMALIFHVWHLALLARR